MHLAMQCCQSDHGSRSQIVWLWLPASFLITNLVVVDEFELKMRGSDQQEQPSLLTVTEVPCHAHKVANLEV